MNPVLLKPETRDRRAGDRAGPALGNAAARATTASGRRELLPRGAGELRSACARAPTSSSSRARARPAEINLRAGDIANMGFAEAADVPVVLVGDIDRGGVIASLVGTHAVLPRGRAAPRSRASSSTSSAATRRCSMTGWRRSPRGPAGRRSASCRWFADAARLPAEDVLDLATARRAAPAQRCKIAVPRLPRIANFDDLDPLRAEPDVDGRSSSSPGEPIPGDCDLVILPGSKATIADLAVLRARGLGHRHPRASSGAAARVLGLCGGYQMLGRTHRRSGRHRGRGRRRVPGLGLLDVETVLAGDKTTRRVAGGPRREAASRSPATRSISAARRAGHARGRSSTIGGRPDGAISADGRVAGTYLHGLFAADGFRRAFLAGLGARSVGALRGRGGGGARSRSRRICAAISTSSAILAIARSRSAMTAGDAPAHDERPGTRR